MIAYTIHIYIYKWWLGVRGHLMKHRSWFEQISQWLERVHDKHEVVGSNLTSVYILYGIENP